MLGIPQDRFDLEAENLLVLVSNRLLQLLAVMEEFVSLILNLAFVGAIHIAKIRYDAGFLAKHLDGPFLGDVGQADDTVRFSLRGQNPDPADFTGVVSMRSTASFNVDSFDVDYAKRITWYDTALIEAESMFLFGDSLVHESFFDLVAVVDQTVGHRLNLQLLLACDALVVGDVEMGLLGCLLSSSLPDMWTKHPPARSKDDVRPGVMSLKLSASIFVDHTVHFASFDLLIRINQFSIKNVKDNLTNFLAVYDLVLNSLVFFVQVPYKFGAMLRIASSLFQLGFNFERSIHLK